MNRITPLTVFQTIARNRRDALAKVSFRDRLMPLNGFLSKLKVDTHSAHINITELLPSAKIVLLISLPLLLSNDKFLVDSLNFIRLKRMDEKQNYPWS